MDQRSSSQWTRELRFSHFELFSESVFFCMESNTMHWTCNLTFSHVHEGLAYFRYPMQSMFSKSWSFPFDQDLNHALLYRHPRKQSPEFGSLQQKQKHQKHQQKFLEDTLEHHDLQQIIQKQQDRQHSLQVIINKQQEQQQLLIGCIVQQQQHQQQQKQILLKIIHQQQEQLVLQMFHQQQQTLFIHCDPCVKNIHRKRKNKWVIVKSLFFMLWLYHDTRRRVTRQAPPEHSKSTTCTALCRSSPHKETKDSTVNGRLKNRSRTQKKGTREKSSSTEVKKCTAKKKRLKNLKATKIKKSMIDKYTQTMLLDTDTCTADTDSHITTNTKATCIATMTL